MPASCDVNSSCAVGRLPHLMELSGIGNNGSSGVIVCPGKFDSFHIGHLSLARVAADLGRPVMLSFSGMAETLGWPPRAPVVAPIERAGILRGWSAEVEKKVGYKVLQFSDVRALSPKEFVDLLVTDLGATGLVCGSDWRFGHKASGDVSLLRQLAAEIDSFAVRVVDPVVLDDGMVSSTAVREAIAVGDIAKARVMMGRPHRLVGLLEEDDRGDVTVSCIINQVPGDGAYQALLRVPGRREPIRSFLYIERPQGSDPMQRNGMVNVRLSKGESIYCNGCEIYIDLEERVK